jgi:hypothetical protein
VATRYRSASSGSSFSANNPPGVDMDPCYSAY